MRNKLLTTTSSLAATLIGGVNAPLPVIDLDKILQLLLTPMIIQLR